MPESNLPPAAGESRLAVQRLPSASLSDPDGLDELTLALARRPIELSPRYLYDAVGSELFEQITHLEAYYPTRAEAAILQRHAAEILSAVEPDELFEIGSGSSRKTRLLIEALGEVGGRRYRPFDVSEAAVREAGVKLVRLYPWLRVEGVVGDFHQDLSAVPRKGRRLVAFLGSTLGNLHPPERARFLANVRELLAEGDALLLGYDLAKDPAVLERAYDDPEGLTERFVRNGLAVLGRAVGAQFPDEAFDYQARWVDPPGRMEMRLVARRPVELDFAALGKRVGLEAGEYLLSEVSYKFRRESLTAELTAVGLAVGRVFSDPEGRFELLLARPA